MIQVLVLPGSAFNCNKMSKPWTSLSQHAVMSPFLLP
uniref:Uncharacterized protein n=1 Tax=Anguilla anguilla TaxID=7936 RepID=A0A0E9T0G3_ANGAN